ncbi:hypothetical protein ACFLY7_00485 [Patescibacteria group bacterium]
MCKCRKCDAHIYLLPPNKRRKDFGKITTKKMPQNKTDYRRGYEEAIERKYPRLPQNTEYVKGWEQGSEELENFLKKEGDGMG